MALEAIVARKRIDVAARKAVSPLAGWRDTLEPSPRSLENALAAPHTGFIVECKKASPSKGLIRADFDPAAISESYAPFADGVSVLTDEPYFQGRLDYLAVVRKALDSAGRPDCPVLCKDFVVDPYQVFEARKHGADAVLLMCSVLTQAELRLCLDTCQQLDMDALVEVHDEAELERALNTDARIIGVNNRNLKTLEVDLATSEALCPRVPSSRIAVCESGISNHDDVMRLRPAADAFLIGGQLMASLDLDAALRELVFGAVKICGLTSVADARAAHAAGAMYGGVVLWPKSKRAMTVPLAKPLCDEVPLRWVGVFVDEDPAAVADAARELDLHAVQLHGSESEETVAATRDAVSCEVWKAARVGSDGGLQAARRLGAHRLLVDRHVAGQQGGTGERFDWTEFSKHAHRTQMLLSGGVNVHNAAEAMSLGPYAIDLSSGVEAQPGQKDPAKLTALFAALRGRGRLRALRTDPE